MVMGAANAVQVGCSEPRGARVARFARWCGDSVLVLGVFVALAGAAGCRGDDDGTAQGRISTRPLEVPAAAGEALGHMAASEGPFEPDLVAQQMDRDESDKEQDEDDEEPDEAEPEDSNKDQRDAGEEGDGGLGEDGGLADVDTDSTADGGAKPRSGGSRSPRAPAQPERPPSGKPGSVHEPPTWRL